MTQAEIVKTKSIDSTSQIEIVEAKGLAHFMTYNKLPRLLYRGLPGFAPPLDVERWTLHGHKLNPHFKLVEAQEFLARRDGRWVGRILAQVYKPEFAPVEASRFQFGSLDAEDDLETVRVLTGAAETWLKSRGASVIHGPFSPSINGEMGLLVEGFEERPVFLTPWHPPYLKHHLEALGYLKARDVYSYRIENTPGSSDVAARHGEPARVEEPAEDPTDRFLALEKGRDPVDDRSLQRRLARQLGLCPLHAGRIQFDRRRARICHAAGADDGRRTRRQARGLRRGASQSL